MSEMWEGVVFMNYCNCQNCRTDNCPNGVESIAIERIANEAMKLRSFGYDGPFIGEVVGPLFDAIADYEKGFGLPGHPVRPD